MADETVNVQTITGQVAESVKTKTLQIVIEGLAQEQAEKQAGTVRTALVKISELEGKVKSLEPADVVTVDEEGTEHKRWTKKRMQDKTKAAQDLNQFVTALHQALNEDNWQALNKKCGGGSKPQG